VAASYREDGYSVEEREVPLLPLRDVCQQYVAGDIHFLKIDVEGSERDVLLGMDFSKWRPWIVVVEATLPNSRTETHAQWEDLLQAARYDFVYFDGLNRFYVAKEHPDLVPFFGLPPNVFDGFVLNSSRDAWLRAEESEHRAAESRKIVRRLRANLRATNTELDEVRANLQATQADLQTARADLHTAHADVHATRADLQAASAELQAVSSRLEATIGSVAAKDLDLDDARLRLDELQAQLREQEALFGVTTSLLRARELECLAVKEQAAKLESTLRSQGIEFSLAQDEIGDFKALARSRAKKLSILSRASEQTLAKVRSAQIENENLRYARNNLLTLIGERERQLEALFASKSWKLTWPLRLISSKLRSVRAPVSRQLSLRGRR
jgi:methyltransferase FkbM-like protein